MERASVLKNEKGFTMVEIIAVLVLLGILAAVAIPRYIDITEEARNKAVDAAIAELNSRENFVWGEQMLADANGHAYDAGILGSAKYNTLLGTDYSWTVAPTTNGGTLKFKDGVDVSLVRTKVVNAGGWLDNAPVWSR